MITGLLVGIAVLVALYPRVERNLARMVAPAPSEALS
jgi:hypothetical protein